MNILEVNGYLNAAMEGLHDDPEYRLWFDELVKNRILAKDNHDYNTGTLEAILYELEAMVVGYILDHKDEIDAMEQT